MALIPALLVLASACLNAQSIRATTETILVRGSTYVLEIDRASRTAELRNAAGVPYTAFLLSAEPVPGTRPALGAALSWTVQAPVVEMTATDSASHQVVLKALLKFSDDAFDVRFGVLPKLPDFGYDVAIVNGSWPWGLGIDTAFARNSLSVSGRKFLHGLGAHAYSNVKLSLRRPLGLRTFHALVGVDDEVGKNGSVVFQVLADGKQVASSGIVRGGEPGRPLEAGVPQAKTIELVVTDAGDGDANDHADWGDARFVLASGETVYVSDLISRQQQGARLFYSNGRGFDTTGWLRAFTPEPDDYYSKQRVMVDVRQDLDGERFYAPAPLNLSFQAPAGWFSIGLGELPDATGFRFQDGHVFIPYPWRKMQLPAGQLYWTSPLCFTFNRSEWEAIADYRKYLLAHKYAADVPIEEKQIPAWWMWPLLCTWSEQAMNGAAQASPTFTPDWVKSYVLGQEKALGLDRFTVIIDDKWQRKYGDPRPDPVRFAQMRELVDWIHGRGHKVLLWWRCWYGEPGSLPDEMGLLDNGYIDATHPQFESYVRRAMRTMLGNGHGELDADGVKVDYIFDVRDPATASYAQPSLGMGIREVYRFADVWYREAKKVKRDCLLTFSGSDPHFALVQDMTRLNDAGRDPLQRQWRARVSAQATPNLLIDGDGADMFVSLADYHHVVSSAYGTPSLYNLTRFSDGPITEDMHKLTGKLFRLAAMKKPGHAVFRSPGNWQYISGGRTVAESFQDGAAFVVYPSVKQALVISTQRQDIAVPIQDGIPVAVRTEAGAEAAFQLLPGGGLVIPDARRGEVYAIESEASRADLGPKTAWQTEGVLNFRPDGHIALERDGRGLSSKEVELNVDRFPVLLVRMMDSISMPRGRWTLTAEKTGANGSPAVRLIEKSSMDSYALVPLKSLTGWTGRVRFKLALEVDGPKGDWIGFENLEGVRLTDAVPPAPKLASPGNNAVLSRNALDFCWYQSQNAIDYEIQVSRDTQFSQPKSFRFRPPYVGDKASYLPFASELPEVGRWFWRMRAVNIAGRPGDWSETRGLRLKDADGLRLPALSISRTHPLVILHAIPDRLSDNWSSVPPDIKGHVVLRVEVLPTEALRAVLETAQKQGIPVIVQASGPRDYYGSVHSRVPLSEIERIFQEFPAVKAVYICEQAIRKTPANTRILTDYAERLLALAAEYGRTVVWADAHWGRNIWIDVGRNADLLSAIRKYRRYFVPMWKMNGALTPYSAHDAVFGLWVSGAVDNWGAQAESWYWNEAGFAKLNQQHWFKEGELADMPPSFYGQMILLGLSSGAAVYSVEPPWDIWGKAAGLSEISKKTIVPLLSAIIRRNWVPGRSQVLANAKSVYVAGAPDSQWSFDYGTLRPVYEATYTLRHPFQLIPSTGRYFWLPIVPQGTPKDVLAAFPDGLNAGEFADAEAVRRRLGELYPDPHRGEAWVVQVGKVAIVMNSRENWDVDQAFELPLSGRIQKIAGRVSVNSYLVIEQGSDGLRIHLNGRAANTQELDLWAAEEPRVEPADRVKSLWDAAAGRLRLQVSLAQGATELQIR